MRRLLHPLIGLSVLMLLGGASVATAQETEDTTAAAEPVVVSGTLECLGEVPADQAAGADASLGTDVVNVHRWQASDARLGGEATYTGQWQLYEPPAEDSSSGGDAVLYEIVNDGGHWLCETSRAVAPGDAPGAHTLVFNGEGDYEGMTAYLNVDWSQTPFAFTGVILPGEAQPYAEPQG
jgi:hypothetical protein